MLLLLSLGFRCVGSGIGLLRIKNKEWKKTPGQSRIFLKEPEHIKRNDQNNPKREAARAKKSKMNNDGIFLTPSILQSAVNSAVSQPKVSLVAIIAR